MTKYLYNNIEIAPKDLKNYRPLEWKDDGKTIILRPITAEEKIKDLENWFDTYFDKQFKQSQWQKNFKVSEDPYFEDENGQPKTYADIEELKAQAEIVREIINSLRNEV